MPPPLGLAFIGQVYLVLAAACSLSMGTAVTLVDGLDGLAGGIAALALVGLSVAALPICSGILFNFLVYSEFVNYFIGYSLLLITLINLGSILW